MQKEELFININDQYEFEIEHEIHPMIEKYVDRFIDITNITNINNNIDIHSLIGYGKFGKVYVINVRNNSYIIKISNILNFINDEYYGDICYTSDPDKLLNSMLDEHKNEIEQIITFATLKNIFHNNFIDIYNINNIKLHNDLFPSRLIEMEYVRGISLNKMKHSEINKNILLQIYIILLYINLNGYFHNDINLSNIMIKHTGYRLNPLLKISYKKFRLPQSKYSPVFIDYSFSKKIKNKNKFPIECYLFYLSLQKYNIDILNSNKLNNYFNLMYNKYSLYTTPFVEKIMTNCGIFKKCDYEKLPTMYHHDIINLIDILTGK